MKQKAEPYTSVHPGTILKEELEKRELSQKLFASTIGMPESVLSDIINQRRSISPDIAVLLEASLGEPASFWLELQATRDIEEARRRTEFLLKRQELEQWSEIQGCCDTNELEKFIPGGLGSNLSDKIKNVLSFFDVKNINQLKQAFMEDFASAYFRKSKSFSNNSISLFTWKYMAYNMSQNDESPCKSFNRTGLDEIIYSLNEIFYENDNTLSKIKELLNNHGIRFILLQNQKGIHIDGFSFWKGKNPTITLTLRGKKLDVLAFTLMHEICHVFNHLIKGDARKTCISIDGEKDSIEEKEADLFANTNLIPPKDWIFFKTKVRSVGPYAINPFIKEYSESTHISPAIILGRYQHEFNIYDNGRGIVRSIN